MWYVKLQTFKDFIEYLSFKKVSKLLFSFIHVHCNDNIHHNYRDTLSTLAHIGGAEGYCNYSGNHLD